MDFIKENNELFIKIKKDDYKNVHHVTKSVLQNKSEQGDAESQYSHGICFSTGKGVPVDKEKDKNAEYSSSACYSYRQGTEIKKKKESF